MNFATIKQYRKLLGLIGGGLTIAIILTVVFLQPTINDLGTTIDTINDQRAERAALEKPTPTTDRDLETINQDLARVAGATVRTADALEFISRFEHLASDAGVTATINLGEIDPTATDIQEIAVQVQIESTYSNLIGFLQQLNADPVYYVFTAISIRPVGEAATGASGPRVETTLSGLTFWRSTL